MSGVVTRKSNKASASATTSVYQSAGLGLPKNSRARKTGRDSDDEDTEDKATKDDFDEEDQDEERGVDTIDLVDEEKPDKSTSS